MVAHLALLVATLTSGSAVAAQMAVHTERVRTPFATVGSIERIKLHASVWRLTKGSDGGIWFATSVGRHGQGGPPYLGRIDPATSKIKQYFLPNNVSAAYPVAGPDGNIWFVQANGIFAEGPAGKITRSGKITIYQGGQVSGPLKVGPDGALWGTAGEEASSFVRVTVNGQYTRVPAPAITGQPQMTFFYGLFISGPGGNIWFCNIAAPYGGLDAMTPLGQLAAAYPVTNNYCSALAYGTDGNIYSDLTYQYVLTQTTPSGQMTVYPQYGDMLNNDIEPDPIDSSIWFASGFNMIEFWPATGQSRVYSLGKVWEIWSLVVDHEHNSVWFTSLNRRSKTIFRLRISPSLAMPR